jgi:Holliday junction resolvase RusA-like endonuclease
MNSIKLLIPFMSVSVNGAYSGKVRRFKSDTYKTFETNMNTYFCELWENYEIIWDEWLSVQYVFNFPIYNKDWSIKKKDLWNYEKVLTDTLSHHIPWFLDEKIKHISMSKWDSEKEYMEIEIKEIV